SLTDAILGITTGARLGVAETAAERKERAAKMAGSAGRAAQYVNGYYQALSSGQEKIPSGLAEQTDRYTNLSQARGIMELAKQRLKSIATGRQYTGQAQIDALQHQVAWIFVLIRHFTQLAAQQQQLERQTRASR